MLCKYSYANNTGHKICAEFYCHLPTSLREIVSERKKFNGCISAALAWRIDDGYVR